MVLVKIYFQVGVKVYWLDINYLMLWSSRRADLTSKSIGDPKACKAKQDPMDERGSTQYRGEKSETRWCTLNMAADQKLLDLAGSLLQVIAKTH